METTSEDGEEYDEGEEEEEEEEEDEEDEYHIDDGESARKPSIVGENGAPSEVKVGVVAATLATTSTLPSTAAAQASSQT
jgi:hypothetical protein